LLVDYKDTFGKTVKGKCPYRDLLMSSDDNVSPFILGLQVLTLRRLMSFINMEHPFLMFLDHTQRRSTVGRTPLDE